MSVWEQQMERKLREKKRRQLVIRLQIGHFEDPDLIFLMTNGGFETAI